MPFRRESNAVASRMSMCGESNAVASHCHSCEATEFDSLGWSERQRAEPQEIGTRPKESRSDGMCSFLSMSLDAYLQLLDWTGRQLRRGNNRGRIPSELAPILERIGLSGELWCDVVKRFGKIFKRVAGAPETLAREAILKGRSGYRMSGWPEHQAEVN